MLLNFKNLINYLDDLIIVKYYQSENIKHFYDKNPKHQKI
jgi:hypothetical protein